MGLIFDESYYNNEIRGNIDHPHFKQRAEWIKNYIKGEDPKVYILGCAFGWTVKHLRELGVNAWGVEFSYAYEHRVTEYIFECNIKDADLSDADYIFSWNVFDTLWEVYIDDIMTNLRKYDCTQIHVMSCSGEYEGYTIKEKSYWESQLPNAIIVDYETKEGLTGLPLCWGMVCK